MEYVFIALIALFAGHVKGITAFGSSLATLPLLIHFYPIEEVVIMMLTFNVVLNMILLYGHKGLSKENIEYAYPILLFGAIFTFVGLYLLTSLDSEIITYIASGLIIIAILNKGFSLHIKLKPTFTNKAIVGALSGIGNGIASIDGPPVVFYLTSVNADKVTFKNTLALHFLVMGVIAILFLIVRNLYTIELLLNTLYYGVFASIGVISGMHLSKKMSEKIFQKVILYALVVLAVSMII